jgi:hypothetical protein
MAHQTTNQDTDTELLVLIQAADWHQQRGVQDPAGAWRIEPHQYVTRWENRELQQAIARRLRAPDAWYGSYNGAKYKYVALADGFRYWLDRVGTNRQPTTAADTERPHQLSLWDVS